MNLDPVVEYGSVDPGTFTIFSLAQTAVLPATNVIEHLFPDTNPLRHRLNFEAKFNECVGFNNTGLVGRLRLVFRAKPNVTFVRLAKIELKKMCGGENKKYRRVGNECRLTRCPFDEFLFPVIPVKMVYFFCFSVRYFLSGRFLLRLHTTVSGFAFGRVSEHKTVNRH